MHGVRGRLPVGVAVVTVYSSRDARTKWRDVLDAVQAGETITVTRSGKVVARIVPVTAPATVPVVPAVGMQLVSLHYMEVRALPVGTVVRRSCGGLPAVATKIGPDAWSVDYDGVTKTVPDHGMSSDNVIVTLPGAVKLGDRWGDLTEGQRLGLPVGTVVDYAPNNGMSPPDGGWERNVRGNWAEADPGDGIAQVIQASDIDPDRIITHIPATK